MGHEALAAPAEHTGPTGGEPGRGPHPVAAWPAGGPRTRPSRPAVLLSRRSSPSSPPSRRSRRTRRLCPVVARPLRSRWNEPRLALRLFGIRAPVGRDRPLGSATCMSICARPTSGVVRFLEMGTQSPCPLWVPLGSWHKGCSARGRGRPPGPGPAFRCPWCVSRTSHLSHSKEPTDLSPWR